MKSLGKLQHTNRGFELIEFTDHNGEKCTLQQSSLANYTRPGSSAVWLGIGQIRMHLDDKTVRKLTVALTNWLETCSFEGEVKA